MLSENIRIIRKSNDLLIALSGALDTPVSTLLGEAVAVQPRRPPSALPKTGAHQCTARTAKNHETKSAPLAAHLPVRDPRAPLRSPDAAPQPIPGLGLQRPGNRRHGRRLPRV